MTIFRFSLYPDSSSFSVAICVARKLELGTASLPKIRDQATYLQFQGKPWSPQADLEMNRRICRELFDRYGTRPNLWGGYIPHETGDRTHSGEVTAILRELPRFLERLTPDKKVAHSPWFPSRVTLGPDAKTPAEFAAEWDSMLPEIEGVDVFVIQDSTAPHEGIGE